jgi:hypothetical protein
VGGVTTVGGELIVDSDNGDTNTAVTARASKLKMTGGELTVGSLILGRTANPNAHHAAPNSSLRAAC